VVIFYFYMLDQTHVNNATKTSHPSAPPFPLPFIYYRVTHRAYYTSQKPLVNLFYECLTISQCYHLKDTFITHRAVGSELPDQMSTLQQRKYFFECLELIANIKIFLGNFAICLFPSL
jgi:hypothetical protein